MSPVEIGFVCFGMILVLSFLGIHVAFALVTVGFFGISAIIGFGPAASSIALISFSKLNSYEFAVVPLFLLMSAFVSRSDIGKEAYQTACAWVGHFRGGLAMATAFASGLMAACCGSSLAATVAMGKMAYPEMERYKYDAKLAAGTISAGGTLGILIPPSIGFILVGIMAQLSIGKLFIAGIIPGILEIVFYVVTIHILCRINPEMGPALPRTSFRQKISSMRLTWPVVVLFSLVIGGIYGGVFTPTEAGGIGAFGALVVSLFKKQLNWRNFWGGLMEAAKLTTMMLALVIGAYIFSQFLALTRIPFITSEYFVSLDLNKYIILILLLAVYVILGMVFDIFSILVLTIPIIFPTIVALGFHPVWYAVLMVRVIEIGLITPPFGLNLFGMAATINIPIKTIYAGIVPFLIADFSHVALLILIPSLSTFLPEVMLGA